MVVRCPLLSSLVVGPVPIPALVREGFDVQLRHLALLGLRIWSCGPFRFDECVVLDLLDTRLLRSGFRVEPGMTSQEGHTAMSRALHSLGASCQLFVVSC